MGSHPLMWSPNNTKSKVIPTVNITINITYSTIPELTWLTQLGNDYLEVMPFLNKVSNLRHLPFQCFPEQSFEILQKADLDPGYQINMDSLYSK